jgi:uncharacterized C2H2 Zn-finger protein
MGRVTGLVFPLTDPAPVETLQCPHCGKTYKTREALEKHLREKHPDDSS